MTPTTEGRHRRAGTSTAVLREHQSKADKRMQLAHEKTLSPLLVAAATVLMVPSAAYAQSTQPDSSVWTLPVPAVSLPFLPTPVGLWTVTIGAGGNFRPDFEGATHDLLRPVPIFSVQRAGSRQQFIGPRDGAGIALFDTGGFRAGPVITSLPARKASSDSALNGLHDINTTIELGGFVEYFPVDWFRARLEVRRGFDGSDGVFADLFADAIVPVWDRLTWSAGPRLSFVNTHGTAPFFGIDQAEAPASGLPVFDARGGLHSVGAGTQLRYQIAPQWEVHSYVEYQRLTGDAAASPLITQRGSPNQTTFSIGGSYSFDVRIR
jgi:outer membrane protein